MDISHSLENTYEIILDFDMRKPDIESAGEARGDGRGKMKLSNPEVPCPKSHF